MDSTRDTNGKRHAQDANRRRKRVAYDRTYREAHGAEIRERARIRRADPEFREKKRARRYGISVEVFRAMLAQQRGLCAICGKKLGRALCIDHCHSTGKVRGLLCCKCNGGLGFFDDKRGLLQAAAEYLETSRALIAEEIQRLRKSKPATRGQARTAPGDLGHSQI
jgi:recombination endonuclease VII